VNLGTGEGVAVFRMPGTLKLTPLGRCSIRANLDLAALIKTAIVQLAAGTNHPATTLRIVRVVGWRSEQVFRILSANEEGVAWKLVR
jgi:hypothetical protein